MRSALDEAYEWFQRQIPPPSAQPPASRMVVVPTDVDEPAVAPPSIQRVTPSTVVDTAGQAYDAVPALPPPSATEPPSRMRAVSGVDEGAVAPPPIDRVTPSALGGMAMRAGAAVAGAVPPLSARGMTVGYEDINPPEQQLPPPGLPGTQEWLRRTGEGSASDATRAILAADRERGGEPPADKEGQEPTIVTAAKAAAAGYRALEAIGAEPAKVTPESKGTVTTSSETPAATVPRPEPKFDPKAPAKPKGAAGTPSATRGRTADELPDATTKASISPRFLVELAKSDSQLHDSIVAAATTAGIGSWDFANLVYAASKGKADHQEDGRMGLAGITEQDVTKFKRANPQFRDIDPMNPSFNLLVGATKYRETRDLYGMRTPSSVAAYILGEGRTNELSRASREEQLKLLPEKDRTFIRESFDPDAKPGSAPQAMELTDSGTLTAPAIAQAAAQVRQTGDMRAFYSVMANGLPRGMTGNDGWRNVETKMVSAMIAAGDMVGAQRARELVFQMSHVGANQALMSAYKMMEMGDMAGAANQLALGYWATPDGGLAEFRVTPQGIFGQRYNESTRKPVGNPFQVTKERLLGMMNVTQDPQGFAKHVRESQKALSDLEKADAEIGYKRALTGRQEAATQYEYQRPEVERMKSENILTGRLAAAHARLATAKGADRAKEEATIQNNINQLGKYYWPDDPVNPMTPERSHGQQVWNDILSINRSVAPSRAKTIAQSLVARDGQYRIEALKDPKARGAGELFDASGRPQNIIISPGIITSLAKSLPAGTKPASPIGATPAPAR